MASTSVVWTAIDRNYKCLRVTTTVDGIYCGWQLLSLRYFASPENCDPRMLTKRRKPEPFLMVIEASYKPSVLDRENVPLIKWSHGPPTSAQEEGAKTKDAIPITSSLPSFMNAM